MKIGIIGSGNIGSNVGKHFAKADHQVMFSSRHPDELQQLAEEAGENASAGNVEEAAQFSALLVIAIPFKGIEELAGKISGQLENKIIVDACNPISDRDGEVATQIIEDESLRHSMYMANHFKGSKVVKALNTIYYENLRDYAFNDDGDKLAVPIAGDDQQAKSTVASLLQEIGFEPVDVGKMSDSAVMEPDKVLYNKVLTTAEVRDLISKKAG